MWHREHGPSDVVRLGELQVTSLRRTLLDLARTTSFPTAVISLDQGTGSALMLPDGSSTPGVTKDDLLQHLRDSPQTHGRIKYTHERYTGGREIQDVVWQEKRREDRLRAAGLHPVV